MDCRTSEKMIPDFLEKKLWGEDLRQFILHVRNCPICGEELGTTYLLDVALPRIENGETVKLDDEIESYIYNSENMNKALWAFSNIFRSIEVVAGIAIALSMARIFVLYIVPYIPL